MRFWNKNKIKKRAVIKQVDDRAVILAKKNRVKPSGSRLWRKIASIFLLLVFAGVTAYLLFFSSFLMVSKINVSGAESLDPAAIRETAAAAIAGKYLGAFAKNNIILASKNNIKISIEGKFKKVADVQITKSFPETINIAITERKLMLVLCSAGKCFVVDGSGMPFAEANFQADELGENELLTLNDDSNVPVNLSVNVLDPSYGQYLADIKDKLKSDLGLDIDKNFHTPQLVSGDIRATTSSGWKIYFDNSLPVQKEIDMLKLVLDEKIDKDKINDLEYIDLRTDNKVYYKFKNSDQNQSQDQSQNPTNPAETSSKNNSG